MDQHTSSTLGEGTSETVQESNFGRRAGAPGYGG